MIPTILVVDDDPAMCAGLRDNLEAEGYRVLTALSLKAGRTAAMDQHPDLILLDAMLPDGDGMVLCRQLRDTGLHVPIIMLTARSEVRDKVLALDLGTDDYVVKPFSLRELLARIRAHIRRSSAESPKDTVAVGAALVNFRTQELMRDGECIETSARELELLRYLVAHRGEVLSRETLLRDVWGHRAEVETRTIDNFIVRLRKKIEPNPSQPRFLLTTHGKGYRLIEDG
ncbi:MAG: response regulator transcription factor [Chromatiaceae bacterium]